MTRNANEGPYRTSARPDEEKCPPTPWVGLIALAIMLCGAAGYGGYSCSASSEYANTCRDACFRIEATAVEWSSLEDRCVCIDGDGSRVEFVSWQIRSEP